MFRVFRSNHYEKKLDKLDNKEKVVISKFEQKLKKEPFSGKPLGYKFFREKKFEGRRVIFLVYEEHECIFLITITDKKAQQTEIDLIKANLDVYKDVLEKIIKRL